MFTFTQIALLVFIFIILGFSWFTLIYFRKSGEMKSQLIYYSLITFFITIAIVKGLILYYSKGFIELFGLNGFILLAIVFLIMLLGLINLWHRADLKDKLKKLKI